MTLKTRRRYSEPRLVVVEDAVENFGMRVCGGRTGDHYIQYMDGESSCDCFGFTTHQKCRHVKAGKIIVDYVSKGIAVANEVENGQDK